MKTEYDGSTSHENEADSLGVNRNDNDNNQIRRVSQSFCTGRVQTALSPASAPFTYSTLSQKTSEHLTSLSNPRRSLDSPLSCVSSHNSGQQHVGLIGRLGGALMNTAVAAVNVTSGGASQVTPSSSTSNTNPPTHHSKSPSTNPSDIPEGTTVSSQVDTSSLNALNTRKYRHATIIREGILDKWTNYVGAWRSRYFVVEPGILKYANAPGQHIKETFPLVLCSIRFCPGDPLRLEIEHPHGVLYLRMPSNQEKRLWIDSIVKAKTIFSQSTGGTAINRTGTRFLLSGAPFVPPPTETTTFNSEAFVDKYLCKGGDTISVSDSGDEKSPMLCLMENCVNCRQSLQSARADVNRVQGEILRLAVRVKDQQFREDAKNVSIRLVERLDLLQTIMSRHLIGSETLAAEERAQRKALEKSLRTIAKRNYRMKLRLQKLQRLLTEEAKEGSSINVKAELSVSGVEQMAKSIESLSLHEDETADQSSRTSENALLFDVRVERKRQMVSILAGGFSDDEEGESSSDESVEEIPRGSSGAAERDEDFDEFFDVEEIGDSIRTFATEPTVCTSSTIRRTELPKPRTELKVSLWSILKDCIGRDLSTISMPVYFNEPTSFLQRLAEDFQYASLLKEASTYASSVDRMLWVVLFTISPYSSTIGRTYKPFNPLLGETFELSHRGFLFLAEQVGHHPPVTAYHASSSEFVCWGHLTVKNRFTGKSLEVTLPGSSYISLSIRPKNKSNDPDERAVTTEHYSYQRARAIVNNVIFGKLSLEMFGHVVITNHTCGTCAYLEYLRQGWWSREMHVVRGIILDRFGAPRIRIGGWWSREIWGEDLEPYNNPGIACVVKAEEVTPSVENSDGSSNGRNNPPPSKATNPRESDDKYLHSNESSTTGARNAFEPRYYYARDPSTFRINWDALVSVPGTRRVLWRPESRPSNSSRYYEFGQLTMELNELSLDYDVKKGAALPPTDSRYRPDQRWLEHGEIEKANLEKTRMEEKQRAVARCRLRGEADYNPRWFVRNFENDSLVWDFTGEYWEAKTKNNFTNCLDIF